MKSKILHKSKSDNKFYLVSMWFLTVLASLILGYLIRYYSVTPCFERVFVSKVIDGDTVDLIDGRRVRYIGIDTPEVNHPQKGRECFGIESTNRNRELVEGKLIELQCGIEDVDAYGRYLRYIYVDGIFVNAQLISEGLGRASSFGDENRYQQVFTQLQQYSKLRNLGIWKYCY